MKRYVLLEDKTIVDTLVKVIREAGLYKDKTIIHDLEHGYFVGYLKCQSDNLIDLLEVGDMLEHKDFPNEYFSITNEWKVTKLEGVTAIWKRNGDVMRRYEV